MYLGLQLYIYQLVYMNLLTNAELCTYANLKVYQLINTILYLFSWATNTFEDNISIYIYVAQKKKYIYIILFWNISKYMNFNLYAVDKMFGWLKIGGSSLYYPQEKEDHYEYVLNSFCIKLCN